MTNRRVWLLYARGPASPFPPTSGPPASEPVGAILTYTAASPLNFFVRGEDFVWRAAQNLLLSQKLWGWGNDELLQSPDLLSFYLTLIIVRRKMNSDD